MNPQLEHLIVLQAQDLDLARLRAAIADAPRRVKEAQNALAVAESRVAGLRKSLAEEEKLRRNQESEIGTLRTKTERLRRSLDGATSAAQVSAFEREIEFAQTTASHLEDEELASMERTEAYEAQLSQAETQAKSAKGNLETEQARAARVTAENQEAIAGIEQQRKELRAQVEDRWLGSYDRLSKTRGTAVAEALGNATQGKCAACQMGVRPQRWQDLTGRDHEDEIFTCESCGRILFWDPRRDTPKPWAVGERLRGAQMAAGGTR